MNILGTQFTLNRKSLEIYIAGCKGDSQYGYCHNCHNKETWSFNQGEIYNKYYFNKIKDKINEFPTMIKNIEIYGGEPNDQDYNDLKHFLEDLSTLNLPIWLFTRYDLDKCPKFEYELCDYIKCGMYIEELTVDNNIQYGFKLATSNQHIYKKGVDY